MLPMVHCNHKPAEIRTPSTPLSNLNPLFYRNFSSGIALAVWASG